MTNTEVITTGGFQAAAHRTTHIPYRDFHMCDCHIEIPPWVSEAEDPAGCMFDSIHGFWHQTEEDYERGMSQHDTYWHASLDAVHSFRFAHLPKLRVIRHGDELWCPIRDVASLSGLSEYEITGVWFWDEHIHVRGAPGFLVPDGIRLFQREFNDNAIQLEALPGVLQRAGIRADLIDWVRSHVLPCSSRSTDEPACDDDPEPPDTLIPFHRKAGGFHHGVLGLWMGTHAWLDLLGVAAVTGFEAKVVRQVAGRRRLVKIPDVAPFTARSGKGAFTFVRSDVVEALVSGYERGPRRSYPWSDIVPAMCSTWMPKSPANDRVSLTALRKLLPLDRTAPGADVIGLDSACQLAVETGGFAGWVTALLLADGGLLHGGPFGETPDETLSRFAGTVPGADGRVPIRKVWEFLNRPGTYAKWVADQLNWCFDKPATDGTVTVSSSWCDDIREQVRPCGWIGDPPVA